MMDYKIEQIIPATNWFAVYFNTDKNREEEIPIVCWGIISLKETSHLHQEYGLKNGEIVGFVALNDCIVVAYDMLFYDDNDTEFNVDFMRYVYH